MFRELLYELGSLDNLLDRRSPVSIRCNVYGKKPKHAFEDYGKSPLGQTDFRKYAKCVRNIAILFVHRLFD